MEISDIFSPWSLVRPSCPVLPLCASCNRLLFPWSDCSGQALDLVHCPKSHGRVRCADRFRSRPDVIAISILAVVMTAITRALSVSTTVIEFFSLMSREVRKLVGSCRDIATTVLGGIPTSRDRTLSPEGFTWQQALKAPSLLRR